MTGSNSFWFAKSDTGFFNDVATQSLKMEEADDAKLGHTPSSTGNRRTWTISMWVKIFGQGGTSSNSYSRRLFTTRTTSADSGANVTIRIQGDQLDCHQYDGAGGQPMAFKTTAKLIDFSTWYHIVWQVDTTQGTASDRMNLYINGVQQTAFATETYPSENLDTYVNHTYERFLGDAGYATMEFSGCFADYQLIDGSSLSCTSFGEFKEGAWIPKEYTGSYGTNGFRLEFKQTGTSANASGIGADTSGNDHHFTSTNFVASDSNYKDCPENNFCAMSPLIRNPGKGVFTEGNLQTTSSGSPAAQSFGATFAVSSGKWYWEGYINTTATITPYMAAFSVGAGSSTDLHGNAGTLEGGTDSTSKYVSYGQTGVRNGSHGYNNVLTTNITTVAQGQIIGFALDMDSNELRIYNNGSAQYC